MIGSGALLVTVLPAAMFVAPSETLNTGISVGGPSNHDLSLFCLTRYGEAEEISEQNHKTVNRPQIMRTRRIIHLFAFNVMSPRDCGEFELNLMSFGAVDIHNLLVLSILDSFCCVKNRPRFLKVGFIIGRDHNLKSP